MLIGRQYAGMSLRQIGEQLGALAYLAVSDAVRRTIAHSERDHTSADQIAREFAVPDRFSSFTRKIRFGQVEPRVREESGESSLPGSLFVLDRSICAGPPGAMMLEARIAQ
jgi:hypothetical protein